MTSLLNFVNLVVYFLCVITPSIPIISGFLFWKKRWGFALTTLLLFLFSCSFIAIYWDGYYLPFKPCRPITYPEGATVTNEVSYTTQDTPKTIFQFFDQRLRPRLVEDLELENGHWMKMNIIDDSLTLYWCESIDINGLTGETGCIYVRPEGDETHIETEFFRFEGANWLCSEFYERLPSSER